MSDAPPRSDVPSRLRVIEESAAFEQHRVDQMHEQVLALHARIEELRRRLEALERRLGTLVEPGRGSGDDTPADGTE